MAILMGFPPSNTINPTTYIPRIVEIPIRIVNLPPEQKFRTEDNGEYMKMTKNSWDCRALCYKAGKHSSPGEIYSFNNDTEVIWLRSVYHSQKEHPSDCCQFCGEKLVEDKLSTVYGNWCANTNCYGG